MTADQLQALLRLPRSRAERWAPFVDEALAFAEIHSALRLAHWWGQVGHETGHLRYSREIWGPTKQQLRYEPGTTLATKLGNTRPGDGKRYMGRGWIQVTGRANYAALTKRLSAIMDDVPDFELAPLMLEDPRWCVLSAADYWRSRNLNRYADVGDIIALTKRVNGGLNGLADRQAITTHVLHVLGEQHA